MKKACRHVNRKQVRAISWKVKGKEMRKCKKKYMRGEK